MPYVATDGPPDIDGTHTWIPLAGTAPPILNNRQADPPVLPWIKVKEIGGWGDLPEIVENAEPVTYGEGERPLPNTMLGKTVVYVWEVRAVTRVSVRGVVAALRNGYANSVTDLGTMTVAPYTQPGGVNWTLEGRVLQFTRDPNFTFLERLRAPYRWGGTISIKMYNPRFYQGVTGYL